MSKKKKVLIWFLIIIIIIAGIGAQIYFNYFFDPMADIAKTSLNNLVGRVLSVEETGLRVLAQVPEEFTPASADGYKYIEKEMFFNFSSSSIIELARFGDRNRAIQISDIKAGDDFSAFAGENILGKNELLIEQIIILK